MSWMTLMSWRTMKISKWKTIDLYMYQSVRWTLREMQPAAMAGTIYFLNQHPLRLSIANGECHLAL